MDMRGALRISKFQKTPQQPKWYGSAEIDGVRFTLKGWEKTDPKTGQPWISILFEESEEDCEARPAPRPPIVKDYDDDIPF